MKTKYFKRPCKKCGKDFKPTSKKERICIYCNNSRFGKSYRKTIENGNENTNLIVKYQHQEKHEKAAITEFTRHLRAIQKMKESKVTTKKLKEKYIKM